MTSDVVFTSAPNALMTFNALCTSSLDPAPEISEVPFVNAAIAMTRWAWLLDGWATTVPRTDEGKTDTRIALQRYTIPVVC